MILAERLLMGAAGAGSGSWSFVAASAVATGTNPTVSLPAGWQAGDLLVLAGSSGTNAFSTPAGWTADRNTSGSPCCSVFHKFAGAGETAVTVTGGGSSGTDLVMLAYRGITALDVVATGNSATGVTSLATNSLTTTKAGDLVISVYTSGSGTGGAWTAPGSTTTRVDYTSGSFRQLLVVDETQSSVGATTARTATYGSSSNLYAQAVAFKV